MRNLLLLGLLLLGIRSATLAVGSDQETAAYFGAETDLIAKSCLQEIQSLDDWKSKAPGYRQQLFEMLSLWPVPEKTALNPQVTGSIERDGIRVEKLHFQSMPGLYVTANLYLPKAVEKPAPAILYVCGHGPVITNGISYGNKVAYQHHGVWFAQHGYVCLVVDTLQLGEIQGLHHGTNREGMWWWNSRGYTSAGVEAWNSIRAVDYLQSRPEVDRERIGVTGRSGGGAYSWWVAALDDRIRVAAPVAGITDLENHVVDGVVEGHCDCMYTVNTWRWDYAQVAALVAPRPLLICNSDKDRIFPLDGVMRIHGHLSRIYRLHNASTNLGVLITEGPHKDTQDLQLPVFRWMNRHLKGEDPLIEVAAKKIFTGQELRVFEKLPTDERNTKIHESFVPVASAGHDMGREELLKVLREKVFMGWPEAPGALDIERQLLAEKDGLKSELILFNSQKHVRLPLYLFTRKTGASPLLYVAGTEDWADLEPFSTLKSPASSKIEALLGESGGNLAVLIPRGIGPTAPSGDAKKQTHIRRRYMLLGQTVDSMRVWDIRRGLKVLAEVSPGHPVVRADGGMAVNLLYASLWSPDFKELRLTNLPEGHASGPDYLNILRFTDIPQVLRVAGMSSRIVRK